MNCRFCNTKLNHIFVDLNSAPPSNSYLKDIELNLPEIFYPLKVFVCEKCKLVQIEELKSSQEIFNNEYAYFSSFSKTWLEHSKNYVETITKKIELNSHSLVTEIASNDGYLLQYFKEKGIPCIGIEPTKSTASVAKEKGIDVIEDFFGFELSKTISKSDLILGNNVLAHVPDINDFVKGLKNALKPNGTITMEFPHLLELIDKKQFDTIYHEHYSYLSLFTVQKIFKTYDLKIYDVEKLTTHGGSLRIYATHEENKEIIQQKSISTILEEEKEFGLLDLEIYNHFQEKVDTIKFRLLDFLLSIKKENKKIIAYGAAAKGNTLLNYSGIKSDLINYVVDKSPHKQGKYLPGSHIPIVDERIIKEIKPEYILILPWNIKDEIINQLSYAKNWNAKFIVFIPTLEVF